MKGQTNLSLYQAGLPQDKIWSKEKIKKEIELAQGLTELMHEDSTYSINPKMIVLYNFAAEPLLEKYKSVIFDQEKGIIVSKRCSRQLVHELFSNKLLFGAILQKHINEMLGFKYHHVISVWQHAYFSLNGYFDKNTDWLSLHQMQAYQVNEKRIWFETNQGYRFEFNHCCHHLPKRIGEGITHNWILGKIIKESLREMGLHLHTCKRIKQGKTILHNESYLLPKRIINHEEVMLKQIMTQMEELDFKQIGQALTNLFDLPVNEADLNLLKKESKRKYSIY